MGAHHTTVKNQPLTKTTCRVTDLQVKTEGVFITIPYGNGYLYTYTAGLTPDPAIKSFLFFH